MTIVHKGATLPSELTPDDQVPTSLLELQRDGDGEEMSLKHFQRIWVPGPLIIGAGPSGLATAACLKEKGIPSLILEKENCIASSWRLRTYEHLKMHLPKHLCGLPLMRFPPEFPVYPTKQQFISYLDSYAKYFSVSPLFGMEVGHAEYNKNIGFWRILSNNWEFMTKWLIIATGENAEAIVPEINGMSKFHGRVLHTSCYRKGDDFRGERVLVVGCGNSGMEVSLDLSNNYAEPSMVVRDKLHILPREVFGISTFALSLRLMKCLPVKIVDRILLLCSWLILGETEKYGLKRPKVGPLQLKNITGKTPVLDIGTLSKIKSGKIKVVTGINRFMAKGVEFLDGRQEQFDSVIFATGYKSTVPSWLKEEDFFCKREGFPKTAIPNTWKGENGVYAIGFSRRGLLGASIDANRIAEDIANQWNSNTNQLPQQLPSNNHM